jgi:hypothetical protein
MKHIKLFENYLDDNFDIISSVKKFSKEYDATLTPIEINSGECHFFAEGLEYLYGKYGVKHIHGYSFYELFRDTDLSDLERVYGTDNLIINENGAWIKKNLEKYGYPPIDLTSFDKDINHSWIVYKGKHYDVENVEGVDKWYELNVFKRWETFKNHT